MGQVWPSPLVDELFPADMQYKIPPRPHPDEWRRLFPRGMPVPQTLWCAADYPGWGRKG